MDDPLFNESNQVKVEYNTIRFNKVGDWFRGTLTDNSRTMVNNLSEKKELQTIFEFQAAGGSLHFLDDAKQVIETPVVPEKGEFWSLITSKPALLGQLKKAQIGSIVGLKFSEIKPSKQKGYNPSKIISVYIGGIDPEYQGATQADSK